jgi:two-component system chemotaxis sensor kinase CheA
VLDSLPVVVLQLSRQFVTVKFSIGSTLLADGEPVLILNVQDLFATVRGEYCPLQKLSLPPTVAQQHFHILVVDDSVTSRTLLATILRAQGYLVTTADDGSAAQELLDREQFDLVVADFEMPQVNGIELTRWLRERYPAQRLPVMMVSSLGSAGDQHQAFAAGVQAYMVKGAFDQDLFLATIQQLTANRSCAETETMGGYCG